MCNENVGSYLKFVFTDDKSVGLYNNDVGDIYHSIFGAKSEAEDKFVAPLDFMNNFYNKDNLKVLDICYGIGYNTKVLLKKILQTNYQGKVHIDILEYDKNLVTISPFIKDSLFKSFPEISYILTSSLINEIYHNKSLLQLLVSNAQYSKFFEPFYRRLIQKYHLLGYTYYPCKQNNAFLHNIYYHCISQRIKKPYNRLKINNFIIRPYFDDARTTIKALNTQYDIIFLDAFTPAKLPTLWSYEFFKELYRLSAKDCILVTYSNSVAIRHAMSAAGYSAGKLFDKDNRHCGTIASRNKNLIKNPLDDYDIGLMQTKAGIYYRDKNLNSTVQEIIERYCKEKMTSSLQSSSQFIKKYKSEHNNGKI